MSLGLIDLSGWRGVRKPTGTSAVEHVRPALENLEEREVMASPASLAGGLGALLGANHTASFLPIRVNNVVTQVVNGATQLVAQGTIAGQAFTAPILLETSAATTGAIPILHLHLAPINLNLLGLQVKTSDICLNVDANPGPGNLLGNLLGGLSNALNGGGTLGGFLGTLTGPNDLSTLTSGLTSIVNSGLGALTDPATAAVLPTSTTNILHLSVGPLNLNLLGLSVNLDNCNNGPVTVDINAVSGPGNLLGNLLGSVAHLADNANFHALDQALARLGRDLTLLSML